MGGLPATPANPTGPAYRAGAPFRDDLVPPGRAGRPLRIEGRLLDTRGDPVPDAVIDVWQAGPRGFYDMLSGAMRFRGRQRPAADGGWRLRTLWPGGYLWRPPHVHLKVWVGGDLRLTTQLYLPGDRRLRLDPHVRPELVLAPEEAGEGWVARFDVVLAR